MNKASTRAAILVTTIAILSISVFVGFALYRPGTVPSVGGPGPGPTGGTLSPGTALCIGPNTTFSTASGPPAGAPCQSTSNKLQFTINDQYFQAGTIGGTGTNPSIRIFDTVNGASSTTGFGFSENVLNCSTCTTSKSYPAGDGLVVQVCDQTTACSADVQTSSLMSWYTPIPGPTTGGPGGTVPAGPTCSSPPCTIQSFQLNLIDTSGATYAITAAFNNGTAIAASTNIKINTGSNTGPFGLGSSVKQGTIIFRLSEKKATTPPYGYGYQSNTAIDNPVGTGPTAGTARYYQAEWVQEIRAASAAACQSQTTPVGSDMPTITSTSNPGGPALALLAPAGNKAAYWQVYGMQIPDTATLSAVGNGNAVLSNGIQTINEGFNVAALTTSDVVDICNTFYLYWNTPYYQTAGSAPSGSVSMATFGFTFTY